MKATILFGEFLPDQPLLNNPGTPAAQGMIPTPAGYGPLGRLASSGATLTGRCQGAFACRDSSGNVHTFAGDATKLYKQESLSSFIDVSRTSGGSYATPAELYWAFTQYGDYIIATNQFDVPQYYHLNVSTNFTALPGSPINARCAATIRDFVFLGNGDTIQWSARDNPLDYTYSPLTESDSQILPDGGNVVSIVGGEYGYVFQDSKIRRLTYRGDQAIFQVDVVSDNLGLVSSGAIGTFGETVLFLAESGFYALSSNGVRPIGVGRVDQKFWSLVDRSYLHKITSTIDPVNKIWIVAFPSVGYDTANYFFIYNYEIDRWSYGSAYALGSSDIDCFFKSRTLSLTLEQLDTYGTLDTLPYSLDSDIWKLGGQKLAVFGSDRKLYLPTGAITSFSGISTKYFALNGSGSVFIRGARPIIDVDIGVASTGTPYVTLTSLTRYNVEETVDQDYVDNNGYVPLRARGRYFQLSINIGLSSWKNIVGFEVDYEPAGER